MTTLGDILSPDTGMNAPKTETFQEKILKRAIEVFASEAKATLWLNSELPSLRHRKPIEISTSAEGFEEADAVLARIESGSY